MRWLTWLRMRMRALLAGDRLDRELDEELRNHIEQEIAARMRAGVTASAARREVLMQFGGMEQTREAARDARGVRLLEDLRQDLRQGMRGLRRAPAFALVVLAILALGIGLTSALFAALYGVLLKPLPYAHADRVLVLWQSQPAAGHPQDEFSPANFMDVRDQVTSFRTLGAALEHGVDHVGADGPESWQAWAVTAGFFEALGATAQIGRTFSPAELQGPAARVLILSHGFWTTRFGADPGVLGTVLTLDDEPWQVIGVMPAAFQFPSKKDVYLPVALSESMRQQRGATYLTVVGELAPGVSRAQAAGELSAVAARLAEQYPRTNTGVDFVTVPLKEQIVGDVRPILVLLMSAVGLLLLVACSNVANLLLARTTARGREFAIRGALGARGLRLARQMLAEGAVIAIAGCAAGLVLAYYGVKAIRAFAPADLPRLEEIAFEPRVALFAAVISALTALIFTAVPAWRTARVDPQQGLGTSGTRSTQSMRRRRLSGALVIIGVAFSFMLVIAAGLITRSFVNLTRVDPGYHTDGVLTMSIFLYGRYNTPEERRVFVRTLGERLRALPGVNAFGVTTALPLHERIGREDADIVPQGMQAAPGEAPVVRGASVTPGYFTALRIPLLQGRMFTAADDTTAAPVALISDALRRRFFADTDPIGRTIIVSFPGGPVTREIIGVVGDVRHSGLDDVEQPAVYVPYDQATNGALVLGVRTSGEPSTFVRPISAALWEIAPTLPLYSLATLDDLRAASLRVRRFVLLLLGLFAASALALAVLGVYGVLSNATAERTREIGVRLALGARTTTILAGVLGSGAWLTGLGLVIGTLGAIGATGLLQSMLFGVAPLDPVTFIGAAATILGAAVVASLAPAWRASRVDPAITLKD